MSFNGGINLHFAVVEIKENAASLLRCNLPVIRLCWRSSTFGELEGGFWVQRSYIEAATRFGFMTPQQQGLARG